MFFGVCKVYLKPVFILVKYLSIHLIVLVCLLQEAVFSVLAKFGVPACRGNLSPDVRGEGNISVDKINFFGMLNNSLV